jgi:hypothetical protein
LNIIALEVKPWGASASPKECAGIGAAHEIERKDFSTAKTRRARRNEALKKPREEIEQEIHPVFQAQLLTHLKLSGHRPGDVVSPVAADGQDSVARWVSDPKAAGRGLQTAACGRSR